MTANRFMAFLAIASLAICAMAQDVMYYLPKTEVLVEVIYEEQVLQQGPYYQYAERYLGVRDIILENQTKYEIKEVRVRTKNVADVANPYFLTPGKNGINQLCLNKDGVLAGVNMVNEGLKGSNGSKSSNSSKGSKASSKNVVEHVPPFMEEQLLAGSISKVAEGVAKQIYRLREAKMNLITGDVDHFPADGKSMETVLKEMNRQEKELTALFVGSKQVTTHTTVVKVALDELPSEAIAFRFSKHMGVVNEDDLSGEPYYVQLTEVNRPSKPALEKAPATSGVNYVMPAILHVQVTDGMETIVEKDVKVAQLGYVNYLSLETMKKAPAVRLGSEGQLLSIEQ